MVQKFFDYNNVNYRYTQYLQTSFYLNVAGSKFILTEFQFS